MIVFLLPAKQLKLVIRKEQYTHKTVIIQIYFP